MFRAKIVLALCASLGTVSTAFAVDPAATDLQAQLQWRAAFGGASRHLDTGYGFSVGYRAALNAPSAQILQLDISDRAALARLVGLPLLERTYRLDQNESTPVSDAASEQPWYAQSWVWWTVGGIAVAAATGGSSSSGASGTDSSGTNQDQVGHSQGVGTVNGNGDGITVCGTQGTPPLPDSCATAPVPTGITPLLGHAGSWFVTTGVESYEGTGGMGDLIAR